VPELRRLPVLSATAVAALSLACAHTPPRKPVSPGGRIEFSNQTGEPLEVFASGARVAVLARGASVSVDRLPLGPVGFEAVGKMSGTRLHASFDLLDAAPASWAIRPSPEQEAALARLPTGRIEVRNGAPEPVRVFVDDEAREMVWPGGEAAYSGIPLGRRRLRAEGVKSGFGVRSEVVVTEGAAPVFDVVPPRGSLRVANRSTLPAFVSVEGFGGREVQPGATFTIADLPPGAHRVAAVDLLHRPMWESEVTVRPGEVVEAAVPLPAGVLAVVSDLHVPVAVVADGRRLGDVPARGAGEFRGLPPGLARLQATGPDGTVLARARIRIPAEGQATWMAKPGSGGEAAGDEGSLMVVNRTPESIALRVDGWDRGHVPPGGRRVVPGLVPGRHTVAALGAASRDVSRALLDVTPGAEVSFEVVPAAAVLAVRNTRPEEVRLILDGTEIARVAAAESADLRIAAGRHELHVRGVGTLATTLHALDLQGGQTTRLDLTVPTATLVVTNRQGEPLAIGYGDRQLGVVLPGDRVTLRDVAPGTYRLVARSLARPLSWTVPVTLSAGDTFKWDLQK